MAHMGDKRGANRWKPGGWRPFEDVGLYGRITLNSIFRLIQIIHMSPGQQSGKK